ncbi:MAG: ribbon-helix-helix domain-containing protein [Limosilactobacillus mucosae]|nr:ribbon-helix-helix domain-containing protein [Limosilactobacillus mucosae]MCI1490362.1 ribbon-helix-helix domain-containing protein [Limosilactobacillus mucosae]MCI1525695.1 ribbon-helix-helix domain-containing protein [Limosilactobacillus mucosae]
MEKRSFTLRLPADLDKALKELARSSNQTKSQVIRDAIKFHLNQNTKRGDRNE